MRLLFRLIGLVLFVTGLVFVARDLFRWFLDGFWQPALLGEVWSGVGPASLASIQQGLERVAPALWDPGMVWLLSQPAFAVTGVLGIVLLALTPRRSVGRRGLRY